MNLILSIEKKYFDLMLKGLKKYEFRRKIINDPCNAFIYIPNPYKEIQGYIEFDSPIVDTPENINQIALSQGLEEDSDILEYMEGLEKGYAIPVKEIKLLKSPVKLSYLREHFDFTAPQSYVIVDKKPELLNYLLKMVE